MSTQFGLRASRFASDPVSAKEGSASSPPSALGDDFTRAMIALGSAAQDAASDRDTFLKQLAEDARRFTGADSTVIALRRASGIFCVARSGPIGPPPGAQLGSRSGISAECLRQGRSLRCKDSETDPRVDGDVCRQLAIRSIVVVPVFQGADVVGLVEAFSARPYAFEDEHLSTLEQLASLVGHSKALPARDASNSPLKHEQLRTPDAVPSAEVRSRWADAFQLRPYQVAIVIGFLLLDLVTVYWWRWH